MTARAGPATVGVERAGRPAARAAPLDWAEAAIFALSVGMVLIYAQIWYAPLTAYGTASPPPGAGAIFYLGYVAAVAMFAMTPGRTLVALSRAPLLIALLLVAAASYAWSIAPGTTINRVFALGFTTLAGVTLASRWRWRTLAEVVSTAFAVMSVGSLLITLAKPDWGKMSELFPGAWRGLWLEKNSLGDTMAIAALIQAGTAALVPQRRWLWLGLAALAILLVLLSTSKTALVVMVIGFAAMGFAWLVQRGPVAAVVATWLAVAMVASIAVLAFSATDTFFELLGKDATLTGRTRIWDGLLRQSAERPWTGYGYGAIWDNPTPGGPLSWISDDADFKPAHAHNGWLELLINIGLPGVILFGLWLLETWVRSFWAAFAGPAGWIVLPATAAYSLTMLTESITLNWHDLRWVLFVALAVKLALGDEPDYSAGRPAWGIRAAP